MIYGNILGKNQIRILEKLKNLPAGTYLAGGTALALQLGHRTSFDFDFYTGSHFEPTILLEKIKNAFQKVSVERVVKDTLLLNVDGVGFSLFFYPYKLIGRLIPYKNIKVASVEDICAMKMVAISMRGKRRDFVDVYYLLKKYSLAQLMKFTLKKYPAYQPMIVLKGLLYFEDAEDEDLSRGIKIFDPDFSWKEAKRVITREVEEYQQVLLNPI
ncbi:hypothetical protein COT08_01665 [Candidatus Woesebacteria bacterium CG07_land_8_20_14_0_80_44_9]|uniref:Nucleotidyl transferase AbiEii/AbiGii toxin family protein n=3 Tax=Candidatus Woeseibacteriota TaxID=1752722 RepID=A0A2H0BI39_9BACT|nr:MAG: hypothetical protein COX04_00185 [Candidatus Woesebacteria bacterium CG22_combo_CG10-13_8_21_14_all_45_10]PIU28304.1 MAG: hypothetical protein COT08_01665 [Candidatus Woesebacteria bacterium CG07_land_8_20_14_0_80_44_9]PIZ46408.1 MAG: hypothetical protein COY30_00195 [Candidatus Woesebacteria bacterium CG_4_10_14_0_2_um_filter_44_9]